MFKIGVTGSICSGKSLTARLLSEYADIPIISCDGWSKEIICPRDHNPEMHIARQMVAAFGRDIYDDCIHLDKEKLKTILATDRAANDRLNAIVFPEINKQIAGRLEMLDVLGSKYVIVESAFLFEAGLNELVDYIAVVYTTPEIQAKRIKKRDGRNKDEVDYIVATHTRNEQYLTKNANFLVRNTIGLNVLRSLVCSLWADIKSKDKADVKVDGEK